MNITDMLNSYYDKKLEETKEPPKEPKKVVKKPRIKKDSIKTEDVNLVPLHLAKEIRKIEQGLDERRGEEDAPEGIQTSQALLGSENKNQRWLRRFKQVNPEGYDKMTGWE